MTLALAKSLAGAKDCTKDKFEKIKSELAKYTPASTSKKRPTATAIKNGSSFCLALLKQLSSILSSITLKEGDISHFVLDVCVACLSTIDHLRQTRSVDIDKLLLNIISKMTDNQMVFLSMHPSQ